MNPMDTGSYLASLDTEYMGHDPFFLDETGSTNDWISFRLPLPGIERTVVAAERQTDGRGRMGRTWFSQPGGSLAFSVAWPMPERLEHQPGVVTLAAGVALAEMLEESFGVSTALKYPNDVWINGKKAAGILTELKSGGEKKFAVLGVGINVNIAQSDFPDDLDAPATSLLIETKRRADREMALAHFMNRLEPTLELLANGGLDDIMFRYRRLAAP
ncbi:MAG: biotin--[acetyl-CoA-carboxylase] ligase, partial [Nitrospinota bacterium]|nr:biotin--[acetyl-CoA-carboxylase] ligase [Nitrospinota bacterium]